METVLKNQNLTAKINSKGAELTSLRTDDREYIWEGNPDFWGKHSPVLFPIVGTLKSNEFVHGGKTYSLTRHGFARDMDFEKISETEDSIVFSLQSNAHTKSVYPFDFEFQIRYTLEENQLAIGYKISNKSDTEMHFSVGAHPAFSLPGNFSDYAIEMEKPGNLGYYLLENDLISDKTSTLETINGKFRLDYELFKNDALIFKHISSQSLTILEKGNPLLKVDFQEFPYLGIWTKMNAPFICIEPWFGHSDPVNASGILSEKEGIQTLKPLSVFDCTFTIKLL